jgi:hypothetical protein
MAKAVIIDEQKVITRKLSAKIFPIFNIVRPKRRVLVNQTIPFRVKFTNIGIEGYGPNNVPGVGIQVIGYSNYIL